MYDIFYICNNNINVECWNNFQKCYPRSIKLENVKSFSEISNKSFTKMFWVVWDNLSINKNFNLDSYSATEWDNQYIHVFKNGEYYDGICLFPKNAKVSQREFDYRFFTEKKEIDIVASYPRLQQYDIVFISYNEPNADENYQRLVNRFPRAKRVHGVKGIHQAHIKAAEISSTEYFWVVDGDSIIVEDFVFEHHIMPREKNYVFVYKSINPINNLEYGYGGAKLLPRENTIKMSINTPDMTTSISKNFKVVNTISNITAFNTDPFNTWKSAFRECVKLSSKIIDRQNNTETSERLNIWCSVGSDKLFGKFAVEGAIAGVEYGTDNKNDITAIKKINDFDWLKEYYEQRTQNIHS